MATIMYEKFTIFGHGYDATRNDSGRGTASHEMDFTAYGAMIDETDTYLWVVNGGTGNLQKYRISNMTEVEQSTVPTTANIILHPSNVDNNIGVAFVGGTEVCQRHESGYA